jgi:hypothetical protein
MNASITLSDYVRSHGYYRHRSEKVEAVANSWREAIGTRCGCSGCTPKWRLDRLKLRLPSTRLPTGIQMLDIPKKCGDSHHRCAGDCKHASLIG